jgi:GDP-fucose protein O-fucosyltransferase
MKKLDGTAQYLTFEPDAGGWNNIRMAMETVLAMAVAMGRTLVLPPEAGMYLLKTKKHHKLGTEQRDTFSFNHFFPMDAIHKEFVGLDIIPMHVFLERVALTGQMVNQKTGQVSYPPDQRTQWDRRSDIPVLYEWLRSVSYIKIWVPEDCLVVFPASHDVANIQELRTMEQTILQDRPNFETYIGHPVPVDAPPMERLRENWADRKSLCIYDMQMQNATFVHFPVDVKLDARLLVHFYAFLFFQNWKQDLWMKRYVIDGDESGPKFVGHAVSLAVLTPASVGCISNSFIRDHVRYTDEIQCAAARVVAAVRKHARTTDPTGNPRGLFDAFHVRRGDFQYVGTRVEAAEILKMAQRQIPKGATLYMATDERDKNFFQPLKDHYDLVFLDDFHDEALVGINTNFYGMIDQLVATRSRIFYGCWFSTYVLLTPL